MENQAVAGLRSRSRSKTPFLRSSSDRDSAAVPEHNRRRTPKRSTPMKHLPAVEESALRTRATTAASALLKTSDYSSEESPDRLRTTEQLQNKLNSHYEYSRVTTSTRSTHEVHAAHAGSVADHSLSPIQHASPFSASYVYGAGQAYNASRRSYSPAHSACSTDSSFAEQALADVSRVTERDRNQEHLPYKLYKMAGEYWNKYPKTDYTYSPLSRDRVELAPGQVAVPNMSRRSLSQFRLHGASTTDEELRQLLAQHESAWGGGGGGGGLRKRYTHDDSSEDEPPRANGGYTPIRQRWLLTRWLIAVYTAVTTTVTSTVTGVSETLRGKERSYAYTHRPQRKQEVGVTRRAAAALAAPFLWVYRAFKQVITTTTTTTETTTWNSVGAGGAAGAAAAARARSGKRRLWPWLMLLLLPIVGYGSYYTYENYDSLALPDFTGFDLPLPEFTLPSLPALELSMPEMPTMPEMPMVREKYNEYKYAAQNRLADASEYMTVVASSCYEEVRRFCGELLSL